MVETANNLSAPEEEDDEFNEDLDPDWRTLEENRCPVCGVINPNKTLIECTHCCKRYHITCVNIRKSQLKQLTRYSCRSCRNVSNPNHDTPNTETKQDLNLTYSNTWGHANLMYPYWVISPGVLELLQLKPSTSSTLMWSRPTLLYPGLSSCASRIMDCKSLKRKSQHQLAPY